jgi:hypothetical protein
MTSPEALSVPQNHPPSPEAAIALKEQLRQQVIAVDDFDLDNLSVLKETVGHLRRVFCLNLFPLNLEN